MFTYLSGEDILFSNDTFGQHYASELMYNDKVDSLELLQEAIKYYENILTPFSPLGIKKIEEIISNNYSELAILNSINIKYILKMCSLTIDYICSV